MDSLCGVFFYLKIEHRRKTQRSEDTQSVLVKAFLRLADAFYHFVFYIIKSAEHIDNALIIVAAQGIYGEITPFEVFGKLLFKLYAVGLAVVGICSVAAECSYLKRLAVDEHGECAVLYACFYCRKARKDFFHHIGRTVCADVIVVGGLAENGISDAAADYICLETLSVKQRKGFLRIIGNKYLHAFISFLLINLCRSGQNIEYVYEKTLQFVFAHKQKICFAGLLGTVVCAFAVNILAAAACSRELCADDALPLQIPLPP